MCQITGYTLDPNSNRTRLTWPDGYAVDYGYDTLNRMMTATGPSSTTLATYSYDALSRRTSLAYGNTASMAYSYSDGGDLLSLAHDFATNSKNVSYTMTYNPSPSSPSTHQLASEDISKNNYEWQPSGSSTDSYAAVNTLNQYPSVNSGSAGGTDCQGHAQAMSYDCSGNLTGDGTWSYVYDPENHMMSANKTGTSATYAYDPLGRRQTKTVGSTVTNLLNDGDDLLAEYDGSGSGTVLRRFVPGPAINDPIAYENCAGATAPNCTGTGVVTEFYHSDHHGSVVTMSAANGDPDTAEGPNKYDPFGRATLAASNQPFRYVGMYYDAETGTYQDRARVYGPNIARFFQTDPVGYAADLNLYAYVGNDPNDKTDPMGLACRSNTAVTVTPSSGWHSSAAGSTCWGNDGSQNANGTNRGVQVAAAWPSNGGPSLGNGANSIPRSERIFASIDDTAEIVGSALKWVAMGRAGEREVERELTARGYKIVQRQFFVRTSSGLRVTDFLVTGGPAGGLLVGFEVKVNGADRTPMQVKKDQLIEHEGGTVASRIPGLYGTPIQYATYLMYVQYTKP